MFLSLTKFRNNVRDFARPNRFQVLISPPSIYTYDSSHDMLHWLAETAQIPGRTQGEITLKYHGMELKLPGDYSKESLSIGFLNSYGWEGRSFFETWMEYMQEITVTNQKSKASSLLLDSSIVINQLGRTEDSVLASYTFYDVFPTNISTIELSHNENDAIQKFTVSFAYSYFDIHMIEPTGEV